MKKLNDGPVKAFLARHSVGPEKKTLEIGSGARNLWKLYFPNITTLDIVADKKPDVVGDVHDLPFENETFDVVLCSEAFEHFHNPFVAAQEISRVLKPGGTVLVTTRFTFPVHDAPEDYFRYTPYGLRELFRGFEVVDEATEGDAFSTIAILLQRIMFQTKLRGGKITKGLIYVLALVLHKLDWLIDTRYSDITRAEKVPVLLAAGVCIAVRKK